MNDSFLRHAVRACQKQVGFAERFPGGRVRNERGEDSGLKKPPGEPNAFSGRARLRADDPDTLHPAPLSSIRPANGRFNQAAGRVCEDSAARPQQWEVPPDRLGSHGLLDPNEPPEGRLHFRVGSGAASAAGSAALARWKRDSIGG